MYLGKLSLALFVGLSVLLVACGGPEAGTPIPTSTPTRVPVRTPEGATPTPTLTSPPVRTPTPTPGFFLRVDTPRDETILRTPAVEVSGLSTPDAVVSVNGQPVEVDAEGRFAITLDLEEGPTIITVVATDFSGNEAEEVLTVIYVP